MPITLEEAYRNLGLESSATEDEVRKAYKKLALRTHPDKNPNDPEAGKKFRLISESYKRITDPDSFKDEDDDEMPSEEEMAAMFNMMFAEMFGFSTGGGDGIPMDFLDMMSEMMGEEGDSELEGYDGNNDRMTQEFLEQMMFGQSAGGRGFRGGAQNYFEEDDGDESDEEGEEDDEGFSNAEEAAMYAALGRAMGMGGGSNMYGDAMDMDMMAAMMMMDTMGGPGSTTTRAPRKEKVYDRRRNSKVPHPIHEPHESDRTKMRKAKHAPRKNGSSSSNHYSPPKSKSVQRQQVHDQRKQAFNDKMGDDDDDENWETDYSDTTEDNITDQPSRRANSVDVGKAHDDDDEYDEDEVMAAIMAQMAGQLGISDLSSLGNNSSKYKGSKKAKEKSQSVSSWKDNVKKSSSKIYAGSMSANEENIVESILSGAPRKEGSNNSQKQTSKDLSSPPTQQSLDQYDDFKLGDKVLLQNRHRGTLAFIGTVHYAKGVYAGVIMERTEIGKNKGLIKGVQYFTCPGSSKGLMVPINEIKPCAA